MLTMAVRDMHRMIFDVAQPDERVSSPWPYPWLFISFDVRRADKENENASRSIVIN